MALRKSDRIVVVGSSLAGLRTIEALRRRGHGGEIVALSAELRAPYDRPPLSKQYLKGEWDVDRLSLRRQGLDDLEVDWRLGVSATALDAPGRVVSLSDGSRLEYGGLVIATGARPRTLPAAEGLAGIHTLRSVDDAKALQEALARGGRLVVVGAGFIGMEVAASARELGLEVTVVEALETPLLRGVGPAIGAVVAARHRAHGVDVRCGVGVASFGGGGGGRVESVALADGTVLPADAVVVGIGVVPEVDWLADSGLDVADGVLCDATGATALDDVVAVGDVARWHWPRAGAPRRFEHWTSAVEQSDVAAARLLGGPGSVPDWNPVPYVWSDQFEMRIAIAGEVGDADTLHVTQGTLDDDRFIVLFGRAGRLVAAVAMRRPRPLNVCRELLEKGASMEQAIAEVG